MNFKKNRNFQSGFTLLELIIVVIIIVMISTLGIWEFTKSRKDRGLEAVAEDIALNIRRAQSMALSVRGNNTGMAGGTTYSSGYGVAFRRGGSPDGRQLPSVASYAIFIDYPDQSLSTLGGWDRSFKRTSVACGSPNPTPGTGNECVELINVPTGYRIFGVRHCQNGSCSQITSGGFMYITFLRPNPDAYFCTNEVGGGGCGLPGSTLSADYVEISVCSTDGNGCPNNPKLRRVKVWTTGQISIE